jgi:hypothetical protein
MASLFSAAKNKSSNELNLFIGSFYFSGEFFKLLLKNNKVSTSLSSLREFI